MPADESPATDLLGRALYDLPLRATGVGNQRARTDVWVDHVQNFKDLRNGLRQEYGIRLAHGLR